MTKAEAIAMLKRIQEPEAWEPQINQAAFEALDMAIEALSQESSEDVISRQAAIDAINALHDKPNAWLDCAVDAVMALPSAQPERTCETCRYNNRTWDMEPCDSCTTGGEDSHYEPSAQPEQSDTKEMAVDIGYLRDWYQNSVLEDEWPDRYIEEVYHDFYLIPKQENEKNESDVDT